LFDPHWQTKSPPSLMQVAPVLQGLSMQGSVVVGGSIVVVVGGSTVVGVGGAQTDVSTQPQLKLLGGVGVLHSVLSAADIVQRCP
jgi:acyl-homoserine lactone acylase PvdQ